VRGISHSRCIREFEDNLIMPAVTVECHTEIQRSFRVEQVAGLFDVPLPERLTHVLNVELPGLDEQWRIGAIVGPSGSGKTTLARAAYGDAICEPRAWPADEALIDGLGDAPLKTIARVLTAVGLGSVPMWLKPYRLLSTGERFRADLARAMLSAGEREASASRYSWAAVAPAIAQQLDRETHVSRSPVPPLLVIDEFTSTLDRTVAKTTSAALARLLRNPQSAIANPKLVVLTCHTDILPWLAPDWTLDLAAPSPPAPLPQGERGAGMAAALRLPITIRRVPQSLWRQFAKHHYLAGGLAASATCYAAFWDDKALTSGQGDAPSNGVPQPIAMMEHRVPRTPTTGRGFDCALAFCAVVAALGWKKSKRITRLVVLPEFQGLGIASRLAETVAEREAAKGSRVTITASHPAIVGHCSRSPRWRYLGMKKTGSTRQQLAGRVIRCSTGRAVASFEFVPNEPRSGASPQPTA
jgi:GNAT superfamily N-acetyltransferase